MIPDAEKKAKDFIEFKGLSSDHFTVEGLFMDIQRATVTVENLEILFETSYSYTVEYKAWRFADFVAEVGEAIGNSFTGKEQKKVGGYETGAKATSSTKVGKTGRMLVFIQPGELGKLKAVPPKRVQDLDVELMNGTVSPYFNDFVANFEAVFSGDPKGWLRKKMKAALNSAKPTNALNKELNEKMTKAIRLSDEVNALSIVMPLGNVYSFKDLALASNGSSKILELELDMRLSRKPLREETAQLLS